MFTISRETTFCYGHRLLEHPGKCRFLHGHNGRVQVFLSAETLNEEGMVVDFGQIHATLETWIEETLDHHTILSRNDPLTEFLQAHGERIVVLDTSPTAENLARLIFTKAQTLGLPVVRVKVWETPRCCASYQE